MTSEPPQPSSADDPPVEEPFDPYRFGKPDFPIPPEYAPPGYVPPAPAPAEQPSPYGPSVGQPYGQPYGQQPQQPYGTPYQYPPSPYGAPPPNWTQYPPPPTGNGKAITAFVFGILSVLLFWTTVFDIVPVLLAVIFGAIAMSDAKRTGQPRGMAMTGFILGIVGAIAAVMFTVFVYAKVKDCFDNYSSGSTEFNSCIDDKLNF